MNIHRFASTLLFAGMTALICLDPSGCNGQTFLIDDFEDCDDDGWTRGQIGPVSPTWDPGFKNDLDNTCSYLLSAANGTGTLVGATLDGTGTADLNNGYFRATVRALTPHTAFGIGMRNHNPQLGPFGDAYLLRIDLHQQSMELGKVLPETILAGTDSAMGVDELWFVQIGAMGDQVSAKAWPVADPEPQAQLTVTDPAFTSGGLVLLTGIPEGNPMGTATVVFDDLSFIVPEPSTTPLACLGLLVIPSVVRRRDRTRSRV